MFRPTSMKRFYLAVPAEREEETIRKLGELGAVQLTRWMALRPAEKGEAVETCRKFMRLYERINTFLAKVHAEKKSAAQTEMSMEESLDKLKAFVDQSESRLDELMKSAEQTEKELQDSRSLGDKLKLLIDYGLRVDEVGKFRHIFVKIGFLNNSLLPKLDAYIGGTSIVYATKPGRPRETFVVLSGLNEDVQLTENTLKLLNFEEFTFPPDLNAEPKTALGQVTDTMLSKEKETQSLMDELLTVKSSFDSHKPYVSNVLRVEEIKSSVTRTEKKSLIHGWIPSQQAESLRTRVQEVVPAESVYLKFENPRPEDEVPVQLRSKGILRAFEIFTNLQGVPNYFEVNPTPIYTMLYVIMFGMMFGDMGGGAVFVLLGVLLMRMKKGLLVFSSSATRKLGLILASCGISGIFFGLLYGEFFLVEIINPLLLSPLHEITEIVVIALAFGSAQIILALSLNILNRVRRRQSLKAVFSGHGVLGLTFYLSGIILAVAFIGQMSFGVFLQPSVLPFTLIAIVSLALVFASPLVTTLIERKEAKRLDKVMEGFGEGLETFISFMANSVSYIRLAAFAIAHGALGLAAVIFASMIGNVPSLVLMNVIVFLVEGFAALIQSLRLMYYEFSTKFYEGDGILYRPFKTEPLKPKV